MWEMLLLEIAVEKKRHKERGSERERERMFKSHFLDPSLLFTKQLLFSFLFLNFPACKKLHKHPPNRECNNHHTKTLNLKQNPSP